MAVFASYNANAAFENSSFLDRLSFASMGQASAVCSKSPNIPNTDGFNFIFTCSENYMLDEVFSVGIQSLDD